MDPSEIVKMLFTLSGTFAALCIPATSVVYFIIVNVDEDEDRKRYIPIARLCSIAGLLFISSTIISLFSVVLEICNETYYFVSGAFLLGCIMVALTFLSFAGVTFSARMQFPSIKKGSSTTTQQEASKTETKGQSTE
jgi:hypothetical protein